MGHIFFFLKELFAIVLLVSYFLELPWNISPSEFQAIDSNKPSVWVHQILLLWMPVGKPDFFLFLTVRRDCYQWIQGNTSTIAQYKVWPLQSQFHSKRKSSILFLKISLAFFDPWGPKYNPPYYVKIGVDEAYTSSCGLSSKARGWNRLSAFWSSCFRVNHTSLTFLAFTHFSLPLSLSLPVHPSWEASPVFCRNFSASLFSLSPSPPIMAHLIFLADVTRIPFWQEDRHCTYLSDDHKSSFIIQVVCGLSYILLLFTH